VDNAAYATAERRRRLFVRAVLLRRWNQCRSRRDPDFERRAEAPASALDFPTAAVNGLPGVEPRASQKN
jgi:hypothetical protein